MHILNSVFDCRRKREWDTGKVHATNDENKYIQFQQRNQTTFVTFGYMKQWKQNISCVN